MFEDINIFSDVTWINSTCFVSHASQKHLISRFENMNKILTAANPGAYSIHLLKLVPSFSVEFLSLTSYDGKFRCCRKRAISVSWIN